MSLGPLEIPLLPGSPRLHVGVFRAVVVDAVDPLGMGRLSVVVPAVTGEEQTYWAIPAVPMAAPGAGVRFVPRPGDVAIVAFEAGDPRFPVVLGYYWDAPASAPLPPEAHVLRGPASAGIEITDVPPTVTVRSGPAEVVVSPEGITVTMAETVLSVTAEGIDLAAPAVSVEAAGSLTLSGSEVTIEGSAVSIEAAEAAITAGTCRIEAGLVTIN